jgi:hypothetical protein
MILKYGIRLFVAVMVCSMAAMAQKASESRPIAQGEYSALQTGQKTDEGQKLDHWLMYRLPDGTFKVDVEIKTDQAAKAEEHLTFTKAMRLAGYQWTMQQEGKTEGASIRCEFTDSKAQCAGKTMNGRSFSTSLAIKAPYVFEPVTDEAIFDFPWVLQAMVWPTERFVNRSSSIAMITMGDGDTEYGTVLESIPQKPFGFFRYLGRDIIEIVIQKVNAHKFEVKGGEHDDEVALFWFSDSGLLLKMAGPEMSGGPIILVLSSYQGPPL